MKHKTAVILLIAAVFLPTIVWAQDTPEAGGQISYSKGDQKFSLNAGLFLPLFFASAETGVTPALENTKPGITGSISWMSFLNAATGLGFEFGGSYALTQNLRPFFMIPILGKFSYTFNRYPIEVPLAVGAGINFFKLDDMFTVTPILKPEAGFYWNWSSEWAFGVNISYWFVPEIYFSQELRQFSMLGNFLDIRLSAMYSF